MPHRDSAPAKKRRLIARALTPALVATAMTAWTACALGGAAASAATNSREHTAATPGSAASPSHPSGMAWHKLKLLNGWVSSQGDYRTGDPSWAV